MSLKKLRKTILSQTETLQTSPSDLQFTNPNKNESQISKLSKISTEKEKWNTVQNFRENGRLKTRSQSTHSSLSKEQKLFISRLRDQNVQVAVYQRGKIEAQLQKRMLNNRCLLKGFKIGLETSQTLSEIISASHFFQLNLKDCSLQDRYVSNLSGSIKKTEVAYINLSSNFITSKGVNLLASVLQYYPSLVKLDLSYNRVAQGLPNLLKCFPCLKILNLDYCNLGYHLSDVALQLKKMTIESISIKGNKLNLKHMDENSINYFYYNEFKELKLSDNPLGPEFLYAIINRPKIVEKISLKIRKFNLSKIHLNSQSVGCFLQKVSDPIQSLNISNNNLAELSLSPNFQIFKFAKQMILKNCHLGQQFAKSLSYSLRLNGLVSLDVSDNNFQYLMHYVAQAVNDSYLTSLKINRCLLVDLSIGDFQKYLKPNNLKTIELSGNYMSDKSISKIQSIMKKCIKLKKICLQKTLISHAEVQKLKQLINLDNNDVIQERQHNRILKQYLQTQTDKGCLQIEKEVKRLHHEEHTLMNQIRKLREVEQEIQCRIQDQDKVYRVKIAQMYKQLSKYEKGTMQEMRSMNNEMLVIRREIQGICKSRARGKSKRNNSVEKKSKNRMKRLVSQKVLK